MLIAPMNTGNAHMLAKPLQLGIMFACMSDPRALISEKACKKWKASGKCLQISTLVQKTLK